MDVTYVIWPKKPRKNVLIGLASCTMALWTRDICKKVLSMRIRKGQCDYFGKKVMTLHVDFFPLRDDEKVIKTCTYFTAGLISDQEFQNTLSLPDYVPCQFSDDFLSFKYLYAKSDNTACYHCNLCPESLCKMCNKSGIILTQLDFNEPRKGKEQRDCDLAMPRSFLCSFVDKGINILTVKDIFNALIKSRINDTKVLVVSFKKEIFKLTCTSRWDINQGVCQIREFIFPDFPLISTLFFLIKYRS